MSDRRGMQRHAISLHPNPNAEGIFYTECVRCGRDGVRVGSRTHNGQMDRCYYCWGKPAGHRASATLGRTEHPDWGAK